MKTVFATILTFIFFSCSSPQYGIGSYNYKESRRVAKDGLISSHGGDQKYGTFSEKKRIKYYNNPKYKQKVLKKRQKKSGDHPIDKPKKQG